MAKKAKKAVKQSKRSARSEPSKTIYRTGPRTATKVPAAASSDGGKLTDSQIQKFREVLTQKRDDLLAVVQRKKEQEIGIGDIEVGDEADIATRSVEKEMLFELTDSEKQTLDMIEAALRKMEKGVYGRCESCQKGIPRMRLDVMPWARYCIQCQSELESPAGE